MTNIQKIEQKWIKNFQQSELVQEGKFSSKIANKIFKKDGEYEFDRSFSTFYNNSYYKNDFKETLDEFLSYLHFIGIDLRKEALLKSLQSERVTYSQVLKKAFYILKHLASYDENLDIKNPYYDNVGDLFFFLTIEVNSEKQYQQFSLFEELEIPALHNKSIDLPEGFEPDDFLLYLFNKIEKSNDSFFITGKAGTGKSTFIHYFTKTSKKQILLTAFTGIAAMNIGGVTLHSFFGFPFKPLLPGDEDIKTLNKFSRKRKIVEKIETIIIDEVSMLRADILEAIDCYLRKNGGNPNKLFGGKQLIFVGDIFQLPPVIKQDNKIEAEIFETIYESPYFFSSPSLEKLNIQVVELQKIYRQNNPEFIKLLNAVRESYVSNFDLIQLNNQYRPDYVTPIDEFVITLNTNNALAQLENKRRLEKLPYSSSFYKATITGDFGKDKYPTKATLELRRNAQIMFVKNDSAANGKRWVNGTMAKIEFLSEYKIEVLTADGKVHEIEIETWEHRKYEWDTSKKKIIAKVVGTFEQFPVKLAWAITIHKSQGLTFDKVVIDLGYGAFVNGQLYTALSRCKTFEGIILKRKIRSKDIIEDNRLFNYHENYIKEFGTSFFEADSDNIISPSKKGFSGMKPLISCNLYSVIDYPTLKIDDFLEENLLRLVYPIDKEKFFDGNLENKREAKDYILPFKKRIFDYFDLDFIINGKVDKDRSFFEMTVLSNGAVFIALRIPIKKGYILFDRIYKNSFSYDEEPPLDEVGVIHEYQFGVSIYPFIQTGNYSDTIKYRVMLLDRDISGYAKNNSYKLNFYRADTNQEIKETAIALRSDKNELRQEATTEIYIIEKEFDYIEIKNSFVSGLVIPKFPIYENHNHSFKFAIDFGRQWTHIEYLSPSAIFPEPFEIKEDEIQIGTLHSPNYIREDRALNGTGATAIYEEPIQLFPEQLKAGYNFQFPQRTLIAERKNLDFSEETYAMAHFNIPFIYEKQSINKNNTEINSNLKWTNYAMGEEEERRIKAFFECLLMMIKAKILINNGELKYTKLYWFYLSTTSKQNFYFQKKVLNNLCEKYLNSQFETIPIYRPLASFYYFREKYHLQHIQQPIVCIEMSKEICDVTVFSNNQPILTTSFKFSFTALFGDGFSDYENADNNGFVVKYQEKIRHLLNSNSLYGLEKIFKDISDRQFSEDIVDFFFSLENNRQIQDRKIPLSFTKMLEKDDEMRIIFVVFYTAIIYHIAKLMKANELDTPRYITFSGTGSKVLNILSWSNSILGNLATLVMQKVYKKTYHQDKFIDIIREEDKPTEIVCKGGLMMDTPFDFDNIQNIKTTLLGTEETVLVKNDIKYQDLDENIIHSVAMEYRNFIELLFNIHQEYNFHSQLEVTIEHLDLYKEELLRNLIQKINDGIEVKRKEMEDKNKPIEETLFFYALIDSLNSLAYRIAQL